MKYLKAVCIIFGITLTGELLNKFLPLPVPSGVYGLFLLLLLLCLKWVNLEDVEITGNFLLDIMPLLFIPVSVGLMESYGQVRSILLPLLAVTVVSTVVVMAVTGITANLILKKKDKGRKR